MNTNRTILNNRYIKGLTLIEVMIAMVIGLLLLSGAISLFINNKRVFQENNQNAELQDAARFAFGIINQDIRQAGFLGCRHSLADVNNIVNPTVALPINSLANIAVGGASLAVEGLEAGATQWLPGGSAQLIPSSSDPTRIDQRVTGTDAIALRYLSGDSQTVGESIAATLPRPLPAFFALSLLTLSDLIVVGELLAVADCSDTMLFQFGTNASIVPGNNTSSVDLSRFYAAEARIRRYRAVRYYIGHAQYGGPSLYRQILVNNLNSGTNELSLEAQELIQGVENMQIMYGVDGDGDGVPDNYQSADDIVVAMWNNVVSVKIALLIRTVDENFTETEDTATYTLLNSAINPPDLRVRRRIFTNTVQIRNRISDEVI